MLSTFYLHSLTAAFLCKNSSGRGRNIHSDFGGYYECPPGKSPKVETETPFASGLRVEGAALQHLLVIQTLKLSVRNTNSVLWEDTLNSSLLACGQLSFACRCPEKTLGRTLPIVAAAFGVACDYAGGLGSSTVRIMCHSKIP